MIYRQLAEWILCLVLVATTACVSGPQLVAPYSMALTRVTGDRLYFAECRDRVFMVDFFTTWSQASMLSIPGYVTLYRKFADQGLCIVGVALDELTQAVEPFQQGMQIPYPVVLADEKIRNGDSPFGSIPVTPVLMVFDHQGRLRNILAGYVHVKELEQILVSLLRQMR